MTFDDGCIEKRLISSNYETVLMTAIKKHYEDQIKEIDNLTNIISQIDKLTVTQCDEHQVVQMNGSILKNSLKKSYENQTRGINEISRTMDINEKGKRNSSCLKNTNETRSNKFRKQL